MFAHWGIIAQHVSYGWGLISHHFVGLWGLN